MLLTKCAQVSALVHAGVAPHLINFVTAYLAPREARVVVDGTQSQPYTLANTVFQGTVFGPCLWNVFFAPVHMSITSDGYEANNLEVL